MDVTAVRDLWAPGAAIDQLGYLVDDIEAAMEYWTTVLGAGPFFYTRRDEPRPVTYRGETSAITNSTALGYAGRTQIELLEQHCRTPSAYTEFLDAHGPGLHHVARFTATYDDDLARARAAGMQYVMGGRAGTDVRYSYWQHPRVPSGAPVLELVTRGRDIQAMERSLYAAHLTWDGVTDPVRPVASQPSYPD